MLPDKALRNQSSRRKHYRRKSSNKRSTDPMRVKISHSYSRSMLMAAIGLVLLLMPQTIANTADNSNPNQTSFEKALQPYYGDIAKALLVNGVVDPDLKDASAEQMTAAMFTNGMQVIDDDTALEVLKLRAEMA